MKQALCIAGSVLAVAATGGCAQTGSTAAVVGMANPASAYCAQLGGKTRIEKTTAGERGICTLPDGSEMDEWKLFRRDHPVK
ncbi:putative hemolysin [Comamonas guangdongensis]|uniref:DUF333 domain-containing protein n=1 Tax=Comamonas guangdongensis TaxID=510515 RepID=A0ABV3ZUY9_9BURK